MDNILTVIVSLASILILVVPGYIFKKKNLVGKDGQKVLSNILLFLSTPMLTFVNFQKNTFTKELGSNLLIMTGLSFLTFFFLTAAVFFIFRFTKKGNKERVMSFASIFANSGYMAIPFLMAVFPGNSLAIIYSVLFLAVFNVCVWTLGVVIMSGSFKAISLKSALLNPAIISIALAIPFFVLNVDLPTKLGPIFTGLESIALLNTPVSMLVLGIKLADAKLKDLFGKKDVYIVSLLKLLIFPFLLFFIFIFPLRNLVETTLLTILFIVLIMPTAAITPVFEERFLGEGENKGAIYFLTTTIFSIITIPLLMLLLQLI